MPSSSTSGDEGDPCLTCSHCASCAPGGGYSGDVAVVSLGVRGAGLSVLWRFGVEVPLPQRPNMDIWATTGRCTASPDGGRQLGQVVSNDGWIASGWLRRRGVSGLSRNDKGVAANAFRPRRTPRDTRDGFTLVDTEYLLTTTIQSTGRRIKRRWQVHHFLCAWTLFSSEAPGRLVS